MQNCITSLYLWLDNIVYLRAQVTNRIATTGMTFFFFFFNHITANSKSLPGYIHCNITIEKPGFLWILSLNLDAQRIQGHVTLQALHSFLAENNSL